MDRNTQCEFLKCQTADDVGPRKGKLSSDVFGSWATAASIADANHSQSSLFKERSFTYLCLCMCVYLWVISREQDTATARYSDQVDGHFVSKLTAAAAATT